MPPKASGPSIKPVNKSTAGGAAGVAASATKGVRSSPQKAHPTATGLTEADKKNTERLTAFNWNGEDPTSRVSQRARNLEVLLFPGATLLDDCARSYIGRLLLVGYRLEARSVFMALVGFLKTAGCSENEQLIDNWASFTDKSDKKGKTTQAYWETNFYNDRADEHMRLKQSLMHPSYHYTLNALYNSLHGVRSTVGPFGEISDLLHRPAMNTSSIFGIELAV